MTAKDLERKAWRLIYKAKVTSDRNHRRLLMQEAFDLVKRAGALRQEEIGESDTPPFADGYQLRLSNGEGSTLWIDLDVESRVDAAWAAYALATACAENSRMSTCGMAQPNWGAVRSYPCFQLALRLCQQPLSKPCSTRRKCFCEAMQDWHAVAPSWRRQRSYENN
jgi:hypothetical protein